MVKNTQFMYTHISRQGEVWFGSLLRTTLAVPGGAAGPGD